MLESQFYSRIIMIALFGTLFILSMLKKGKRNSVENPPERHIALKILSGIFLVLALISLAAAIKTIINIQFPREMEKPIITSRSIIRSTSATQYWGYPTSFQNMALMHLSSVFASLSFAAYFAVFKRSGTKVWEKVLKVIGVILMYMLFASATDLCYFDMYELFAPIGFLILAFIGILGGNKTVVAEAADEVQSPQPVVLDKGNDSQYMPANAPSVDTSEISVETTDVEL